MRLIVNFLTVIVLLATSGVFAATPGLINYQGRLKDNAGNSVADGSYSVKFTIYDAPVGGSAVWTETQTITTTSGLFAVLLGSLNLVSDDVFSGTTRYLGITVGADPELAPRVFMVSVPYAQRVNTVDGARGGNIATKVSIGPGHTLSGDSATISGGHENTADGVASVIGGGGLNQAIGYYSGIAGGNSNIANEAFSFVGGGVGNSANGRTSFVGGGVGNTTSGRYSAISGGGDNEANGVKSFIGGGWDNSAEDSSTTVGGGEGNRALIKYSTIGGGKQNWAANEFVTIAGGENNSASARRSAIVGGSYNRTDGDHSHVGAGNQNNAYGPLTFVGGGSLNYAYGTASTIVGGESDTTNGDYSSVGGGQSNVTNGFWSTVGGGRSNVTGDVAHFSSIGGGELNSATAIWATVGGGQYNVASSNFSTVGGGHLNVASGMEATVPGGRSNAATGAQSFAAGYRAKANNANCFVWGDDTNADFASTAPNQFLIRADGGVGIGTNNPTAMLEVNGAARINGEATVNVLQILGGSDIVEGFESVEENIEPGTVMVIDDQNPGMLKASSSSYDSKVAGVVSGAGGVQPGMYLSQDELKGDIKVAMAGRVYVKCTAEHGPIVPGDLLTTSDLLGHAMKATDGDKSHGTLIGKAMSGLAEGVGLVLVLVNLQ